MPRNALGAGRGAGPFFVALLLLAGAYPAGAQTPGEVQNVQIAASGEMSWDTLAGVDFYNLYQASGGPAGMGALVCQEDALAGSPFTPEDPAPGEFRAYLITGESGSGGEGTPGTSSGGAARYLQGRCTPLMRAHTLNRAGYGWSQWVQDRIATLGSLDAYLAEQLDPASISEANNFALNDRLSFYEPPMDVADLIARHVVYSVYGRRQLEHRMAMFWTNHFNTDWTKIREYFNTIYPSEFQAGREATGVQRRDFERFRDIAFNGNFRDMVEAATLNAAMFAYLDLYTSVAGNPNENQPRELMELHAMGVDAGYTQADVEELSRVMTGWVICKKELAVADDPLAACIADPVPVMPAGAWVADFEISRHDCSAKTLFAGTPQELILPGTATCNTPADEAAALAELDLVLDAVAAHPAAPQFISRKILQLLVTENPTQAMLDKLVAVWNDGGNPQGIGDLREVVREALTMPEFHDPANIGNKVKTPAEFVITAFRSTDGRTDGLSGVFTFLTEAQHLPFFFEVPTGYSELAGDWVNTGGILTRQDFGYDLGQREGVFGSFGSNPITMLNNNGVSTLPNPNNAAGIVDFLSDVYFGGMITADERAQAITFLNTNDNGTPFAYNDTRIRDLVGVLLGTPHFQEQ